MMRASTATCHSDQRRHRRRRGFLRLCLGVTLLLGVAGCVTVETGDGGFAMGGRVDVAKGEVHREDIVVFGGSVVVDGEARRDIVVLGGSLTVNGVANADAVCIGGSMRLGPEGRVRGDAVVVGGVLHRDPGAVVEGELVNVGIGGFDGALLDFDPDFFFWPAGSWFGLSAFHVMTRTTQLVYWLLLAVLTIAVAGDRVSSASYVISREPIRLGAIGLVGFFALLLLAVLFCILSFLLIGIPFFIATVLGWWLAYIFGMVAVFQVIGSKLARVMGKVDASQIAVVLGGGLAIGILHYFPLVGTLFWWIAAFVGLGAVFATRFGSHRPWVVGMTAAAGSDTSGVGVVGPGPLVEPPPAPAAETRAVDTVQTDVDEKPDGES